MLLQALSVGPEIDTWRPRRGVVHSSFDQAVNLLVDGELWTLLGAARADASFGIRLAPGGRPGPFDVRDSDRVQVRAGYLSVGLHVVDCRAAARWVPIQWGVPSSDAHARVALLERRALPRAWPGSAEMARDVTRALEGSDSELARAVRQCVGRGPGLTPSGDDVLVGMLAVLTTGAAGPAALQAASRLSRALAAVLHTTPEISRHLLNQAARGMQGRLLHDLGRAVWEGAPGAALTEALEAALGTGFTSGADACLGLAAACRFSFLVAGKARS